MSAFVKDNGDFRVGRIVAAVIALFIVFGAVGTACGVAGGYKDEAVRVVSVKNVKEQKTQLINLYNSAQTAADNACNAGQIAKDDNSPTLVEDPALAYKATYRRIIVEYNRRQDNLFEARVVGPQGYPKRIPDVAPNADYCEISADLQARYIS